MSIEELKSLAKGDMVRDKETREVRTVTEVYFECVQISFPGPYTRTYSIRKDNCGEWERT